MNVENKPSEIHGTGVFAKEQIPEGHWQYIYGYEKKYVPGDVAGDYYGFCDDVDNDIRYIPYAPFCFTNHSNTPNCVVSWDDETKTLCIIALRQIEVGEELTIDYGYDDWEECHG